MTDTTFTTLQHRILKILIDETSETKRITAHEILDRLGVAAFGSRNIKSLEVAKSIVEVMDTLRSKGYPICSSHLGYFYAHRDETVVNFIAQLKKKIAPLQKTIDYMQGTFDNVGKQSDSFKFTITLPVRTAKGVKYQAFEIDKDGKPIIPEGVQII